MLGLPSINIRWIRNVPEPYFNIHVSYYRQFSTNIKIKIIKFKPVLLALAFSSSWLIKLVSFQYPRKAVYNTM